MTVFVSLRRPPAILGVDTQPMPRIPGGPVRLWPAVRPTLPVIQVPALDLSWTALDLLVLPIAAWLAAGRPGGRHRHCRGVVRRRGITRRRTATNTTGDTA